MIAMTTSISTSVNPAAVALRTLNMATISQTTCFLGLSSGCYLRETGSLFELEWQHAFLVDDSHPCSRPLVNLRRAAPPLSPLSLSQTIA